MIRRIIPRSIEEAAEWYMRYISPLSLVAGFIADNLFLTKRVDVLLTNALLFSYLVVAGMGIVLINLIQTGRLRHDYFLRALPVLPVVAQFAFGGLFSGYLSLYSRSAAFAVSWIFVAVLVVLIIANERFAHFYARFIVQVSLYFIALLSFFNFFLPVVFKRIGPLIFLASGAVSLAAIAGFLVLLLYLMPAMRERWKHAAVSVAAVYLIFNGLYFSGAIPPLPLSLKAAGVYHSVVANPDGSYTLMREPLQWYQQYLNYPTTYHATLGEPVFVWSAVFAPSGLSTEVLHEWQWYDETAKTWVTEAVVSFPIYGGRDGGFRGYSEKLGPQAGQWRVNVVTQYGQLIGRVSFTIEDVATPAPLVSSTE